MTDRRELWTLMGEAMGAFTPFYQAAMREAIQETGVPDSWGGLYLARGSDPKPFSVEHFLAVAPYSAQERLVETLETLAQADLMERMGENAYRLTDQGREAVNGIIKAAHERLATVAPLHLYEMEQLNELLYRIVAATLAAPEPEEKRMLVYSRGTDPGDGAPGSVQVDQYLTDLTRYRDDAHIAAWQPVGVSGSVWEALTYVWRGDARTAEELTEKLPFRGHSAEIYAEALAELVGRGWVEVTAEGYQITEKGGTLRQKAEEETDRIFYAPWACLNETENAQLHRLLIQLKDNLQQMAESNEGDSSS